jgi:hypothetical protein
MPQEVAGRPSAALEAVLDRAREEALTAFLQGRYESEVVSRSVTGRGVHDFAHTSSVGGSLNHKLCPVVRAATITR